jgi:tetratricopeptide (TPR) repeat protein
LHVYGVLNTLRFVEASKINELRFILGQPVPFDETRHREFKEIKGNNPVGSLKNTADEYVVAFLNGEGGSIYWGIRNIDRVVVGVILNAKQRDEIRRLVTDKLARIQPTVASSDYKIIIHQVYDESDKVITDTFIVEITVLGGDKKHLYFTAGNEAYVKTDGGKRKLTGTAIQTEIQRRQSVKNTETQERPPDRHANNIITRIWTDAVLSKVISVAIIGLFVMFWTNWNKIPINQIALIVIGALIIVLWILCLVLYFKKSIGKRRGEGAVKSPAYSKQIRHVALAGAILIPIMSASGFFILNYKASLPVEKVPIEKVPVEKIIILIADFIEPDPQNNRFTQTIYEELDRAIKGRTDLQVQMLGEPISYKQGSDFARSRGKERDASIVLWGSVGEMKENVQTTVNFEVLETPVYFLSRLRSLSKDCGDELIRRTFTTPVREFNKFDLQAGVSRQLNALTFLTIGMALGKTADYGLAIEYFNQALAEWGKSGEILKSATINFWRGNAYSLNGEWDLAISDFNKVIKFQPKNGMAYNNRGRVYNQKGDWKNAMADFSKAIKFASDTCLACAYTNRANIYALKANYVLAIKDYNQAIKNNNEYAPAYDGLGRTYVEKNDFDKAIADFKKANELEPNNPCINNNLGLALLSKGENSSAIGYFTRAIEIEPGDSIYYYHRGLARDKNEEYDKAIEDFNQTLNIDPKFADARHMRGHTYLMKGNIDIAIDDFTEAINLGYKLVHLYMDRGKLHEHKGDHDKAIEDYNRSIELDPNSEAYHKLGHLYLTHGNIDKAISNYKKAQKYESKPAHLHMDLGSAYEYKRDYNKALGEYKKAIELTDDAKMIEFAKKRIEWIEASIIKNP